MKSACLACYLYFRSTPTTVKRLFEELPIFSAALIAFSHGSLSRLALAISTPALAVTQCPA